MISKNSKRSNKSTEKENRKRDRVTRNVRKIASTSLHNLKDIEEDINEMEYFYKILENIYIEMNGLNHETIGIYCSMVPEELIYAIDALPVRLCSGHSIGNYLGDDIAARDLCPLVKASIGFHSDNILPLYYNCNFIIVPTTCDCKRNFAKIVSEYIDVVPLNIPSSKKDDNSREAILQAMYFLKNTLEDVSGIEIGKRRLRSFIKLVGQAKFEMYRLFEIRRKNPYILKGSSVLAIMNVYGLDHVKSFTIALRKLNDYLETKLPLKYDSYISKPPRILITGSPLIFPNIRVATIIEELGAIIAADETCLGMRAGHDPVSIVENTLDGMMRGLAAKAVLPNSCPAFTDNTQRLTRLKNLIDKYQIEGVVYNVFHGCIPYEGELYDVDFEMSKIDIPILVVETDYSEEDVEQLKIRMEAFLEMIESRRRRIIEPIK